MKYEELDYKILTHPDEVARINTKLAEYLKVCYKTQKVNSIQAYLEDKIYKGHDGFMEHQQLSVEIRMDRGSSHALARHRPASYLQESTRYCNYLKDKFGSSISVINPMQALNEHEKTKDWDDDYKQGVCDVMSDTYKVVEEAYMKLIDAGIPTDIARGVLPTDLATTIIITANIRHWRDIFKLRDDSHAHPNIRLVMRKIHKAFKTLVPVLFDTTKAISHIVKDELSREIYRATGSKPKKEIYYDNGKWARKKFGVSVVSSNPLYKSSYSIPRQNIVKFLELDNYVVLELESKYIALEQTSKVSSLPKEELVYQKSCYDYTREAILSELSKCGYDNVHFDKVHVRNDYYRIRGNDLIVGAWKGAVIGDNPHHQAVKFTDYIDEILVDNDQYMIIRAFKSFTVLNPENEVNKAERQSNEASE